MHIINVLLVTAPNFLDRSQFIYFSTFLFLHQITPLHLAAEGASIKILRYLVDQGADINIQDDIGVSIRELIDSLCRDGANAQYKSINQSILFFK